MAVVVGTVLSLINQADVIATGTATVTVWVKVAANYVVPFLTSSTGALLAVRRRAPAQD
ncbi:MAG: nitrate/nitrite transporter NrtS [Actinomycetota bacterium]|nr:nitrate/nitrite transporter NrtS [Actinomycetota bacterium]